VLALSRGGRYTLDNVVPACRCCNTSKCNHEVASWLRRSRLNERAFLLRHVEIRTALGLQFAVEGVAGGLCRAPRGRLRRSHAARRP